MVEPDLAKVVVASSNLVSRFFSERAILPINRPDVGFLFDNGAAWPSGKAEVCKTSISGSNPDAASNFLSCSTARRADSLWEIGFNPPKSPLDRGDFFILGADEAALLIPPTPL